MLRWRNLIKLALFVAVIDGALRKWFFPDLSSILYFLKDLILIIAYFQFFVLERIHPKIPRELRNVVPLFIVVAAFIGFQALNPALGSPIAGLMGLRNYFIYAPLILILPHVFRTEEELMGYLRTFVLLMIPIGILGFFQYIASPSAFINRYVGEAEAGSNVVRFGEGRARITGTFSYIGGYAAHLGFVFALTVPLLIAKGKIGRTREALIIALVLTLANMLMTGSRGPVFGSVLFLILFFGILIIHFPIDFAKYTPRLAILGLIGGLAITQSPAFQAFHDRASRPTGQADSRANPFYWGRQFVYLNRHGNDFGWGTGSLHQATNALREQLRLPRGAQPPELEDEPDRILAEQGPVGFILWYLLRLTLLYMLWKTFRKLKSHNLRNLALAALIFTGLLFIGQMVFHHTNGIYYWFMTAFIALLPAIERNENDRVRRLRLLALALALQNESKQHEGKREQPVLVGHPS